jgi:citrate synthase
MVHPQERSMTDELYLDAEAAAAALGVSVTTIYTYVSRGLIRSQKVPGSKASRYWRTDIDQLVTGVQAPPLPGLQRNLVESSAITLITPGGHFYRGRSAIELSETATLESVAALLWEGEERELFGADPPPQLAADGPGEMVPGLASIHRAMAILFRAEQTNPRAYDLSPDGYRRSGVDVLRYVFAAVVGRAPSREPLHAFVVDTLQAPESLKDLVRRLLVLSADHELDPTTYAARAAANTGVTPYAAAIAGLVSSSGRRLIFGQSSSVARLLEEIEAAPDPRDPVIRRIREGDALPGFASKNYPKGDPRARSLLDVMRASWGDDDDFKRVERAIAAVREATGAEPDFVLVGHLVGRRLGLREDQGVLTRLARVSGWIAHAMEQYHGRELVRPHAAYAGVLPY